MNGSVRTKSKTEQQQDPKSNVTRCIPKLEGHQYSTGVQAATKLNSMLRQTQKAPRHIPMSGVQAHVRQPEKFRDASRNANSLKTRVVLLDVDIHVLRAGVQCHLHLCRLAGCCGSRPFGLPHLSRSAGQKSARSFTLNRPGLVSVLLQLASKSP